MYNIKSTKLNTKIALLSDLHYVKGYDNNILSNIIEEIKNIKPNYICLPGDILDESINGDDIILDFFKNLSNYSKIIISLGNHDVTAIIKHKQSYYSNKEWFNRLNNIKNVIVLDNEQYIDNNIIFTGYNSPFNRYKYEDNPIIFLNDLKNLNFKIDNTKYNILLCHSPQSVLGNKKLYNHDFIKNQDLILCGHMHNGLVPKILEKLVPKNRGFIGPGATIFPKYSKGKYTFNNTTVIISKGILKFSNHAPKFLYPFNKMYPYEIEIIEIKNIEN